MRNSLTSICIFFILQIVSLEKGFGQTIHKCVDVYSNPRSGPKPVEKNAVLNSSLWDNGSTITVKFLNGGTAKVRAKIMQYANVWSTYANIRFQFVTSGNADVRIQCDASGLSNSIIGTDARQVPQSNYTMRFGWFTDATLDAEFSRTVVHEFGHVLGCIHEHQSPSINIPWNKDYVYAEYAQQGWDRAMVDQNIFQHYSSVITQFTAYDKLSIMQYPITAQEVTDPSYVVGWNDVLSEADKAFISRMYPFNHTVLSGATVFIRALGKDDKNDNTDVGLILKDDRGMIVANFPVCCGSGHDIDKWRGGQLIQLSIPVPCPACVRCYREQITKPALAIDFRAHPQNKINYKIESLILFFSDDRGKKQLKFVNLKANGKDAVTQETKHSSWAGQAIWKPSTP